MPPPNLFRKSPTAARPIIVRRAGVHASIIRLSDNADRRANLRMRCHLKLGGEADANTPMSSPSGAPLKFMAAPKPWRRRDGATQYARLIGLSTAVSGILDAPLSRGMTAERHAPSSSRHNRVRVVDRPKAPSRKRAQGMPGEGLTHGPPANKNAGGRNHRFSRIIRHSLRGGFNAYGVLLCPQNLPEWRTGGSHQPPVAGSEPVRAQRPESLSGSVGQIRCSSSTRTVAWAASPNRARKGVDDGTKRSRCRRY